MSYTPTTWTTGDTITATKLNKMEQGIAGAGGGVEVVFIYFPNSTVGHQAEGNFDACLAKVQQGIPIIAYDVGYDSYSGGFVAYIAQILSVSYDTTYPNRIDLMLTSGIGYHWTANGVEYFD